MKHILDKLYQNLRRIFSRSKVWTKFFIKRKIKRSSGHSRVVLLLKVFIPSFIALFLGVLLIFLQTDMEDIVSLDIPKIDKKNATVFKVEDLTLNGLDNQNRFFSIKVKKALETLDDDRLMLVDIDTRIDLGNVTWLALKSEEGYFNRKTKILNFYNNIKIENSDKDIITGSNVSIDLNKMEAYSDSRVFARTELGEITAQDGFYFKQGEFYLFKGKVKAVIYKEKFAIK